MLVRVVWKPLVTRLAPLAVVTKPSLSVVSISGCWVDLDGYHCCGDPSLVLVKFESTLESSSRKSLSSLE